MDDRDAVLIGNDVLDAAVNRLVCADGRRAKNQMRIELAHRRGKGGKDGKRGEE